jgi:cobalt-zinc-cadmium efflux system outer membrane protein
MSPCRPKWVNNWKKLRDCSKYKSCGAQGNKSQAGIVGGLGVLLRVPDWNLHATDVLTLIGVSVDVNTLWLQAEQNNPELESARRETIAADSGLERASRERWPVSLLLPGTAFID